MNLTICSSGVDFTNVLLEAFKRADPKSAKKLSDDLTVIFELLRSARIKAAHKTLVKSTPDGETNFSLSNDMAMK